MKKTAMKHADGTSTEEVLNNVEAFKKMCRLLEIWRKNFLDADWKHFSSSIPLQQYTHLMMIRFALPCNLSRIRRIAGLTPAGASLFVDKLVQSGILERKEDPQDRRNIIISFSPRAQEKIASTDTRLNDYLYRHFANCSAEELEILNRASRIVCAKLSGPPDTL